MSRGNKKTDLKEREATGKLRVEDLEREQRAADQLAADIRKFLFFPLFLLFFYFK